jgi:Tol biopolymer transport system component
MKRVLLAVAVVAAVVGVGMVVPQVAPVSAASFPGANGKIVFTSDRDLNFEVYAMDADGTNPTNLTNNKADDFQPSWSPDGTKIAFTSDRDGDYEVYVMNADGTNPTNLTNNSAIDEYPSWSPDGTKIAFASRRDGGDYEVYVMNADGTDPTRLTNSPLIDFQPSWQPIPTTDVDGDDDNVLDADDVCPDTVLPDVPTVGLKGARFAAQTNGTFDSGRDSLDGLYTLADTAGCSGTQIIALQGLGSGHTQYGISRGALEEFIATL